MKRFLALLAIAGCSFLAAQSPPANGVAYSFGPTTASSGTIGPFNPLYLNSCSVTFASGGGGTFTVLGAADATQGGTYVTNSNFGSSGVITAPAAGSISSGNIANYPIGFEITFTGNTGTISGTIACTAAGGSVGNITVSGSVSITSPLCSGSTAVCTHDDHSPLPMVTATAGALASPTPGVLPVAAILYCWNGSAFAAASSTAPCPVTTPAPAPSVSPFPYVATTKVKAGSGTSIYLDTWPDAEPTAAASSATTTLIKAGVANQNMYVFGGWWESTGTDSGGTPSAQLVYGSTTTTPCDTGQHPISAATTIATGTAAFYQLWGGGLLPVATPSSFQFVPSPIPFIIPSTGTVQNLCGITVGTTINGTFWALEAIHAN